MLPAEGSIDTTYYYLRLSVFITVELDYLVNRLPGISEEAGDIDNIRAKFVFCDATYQSNYIAPFLMIGSQLK
jgi:hypothetical protein